MNAKTHSTTTATVQARGWLLALAILIGLIFASPARAISAPDLTGPDDGVSVQGVPAFAWAPVAGAERYEFEIAADPGFNAPVLGPGWDQFQTRNTRATLKKTIPNGTYWWHVRSVTATGVVSSWSVPRSLEMAWTSSPVIVAPVEGGTITYPSPVKLVWSPVPRARKYIVTVATDVDLGSLVPGAPFETEASAYGLSRFLAPGEYFWSVTPVDAAGHRGVPSAVGSFQWAWPSLMTSAPRVEDIVPQHDEIFDPQFLWDAVPGAMSYDVEVWSSEQAGQVFVCCDSGNIGTSIAPPVVFKDNTYSWRVRAVDPAGHAGEWNNGPQFTKSFGESQVPNLHMRDHLADPGVDTEGTPGYQTRVPIVKWDPVPGASSYDVEVTPFEPAAAGESAICNWTSPRNHWRSTTATTAWTPLGTGWNLQKPYSDAMQVANDLNTALQPGGSYCVRVRPRDLDSTLLGSTIFGNYTYLNSSTQPAFQWTGLPDAEPCPAVECQGYLKAAHYLEPQRGVTTGRMPLFTWKPIEGKQSYFVLVAKDPSFHTIVDYAFTHLPAYAPRRASGSWTYTDETTAYYWAVLPASQSNGSGAVGDPLSASAASFHKRSVPPTLVSPANATEVSDHPVFRWTPVEGARRYFLQVSTDPTFKTVLEGFGGVATDATGYTAKTTYPADTILYWRVRGEDDLLRPFTWSATGTFQRRLPTPIPSPNNPTQGDFVPTIEWSPVQGAQSYELDVAYPNGITPPTFKGLQAAVFTPSFIYGTGIWKWRVRAHFPKAGFGSVPGPYSPWVEFTRTLREPPGAATSAGPRHVVFTWEPKEGLGNGIRDYRVEVSTRPDFSALVENVIVETTNFAPFLTNFLYSRGGTFYWRVASRDGGQNVGDYTAAQQFTLPATKMSSSITASVTKTTRAIKVRGMVIPRHTRTRIAVTLSRKRNGAYVKIATRYPRLSTLSTYATSFTRPRRGACRVQARFPGDADSYARTKVVFFRC
jgi:hypothetical protein